jgi:2-keto-4-pentenoate hydratase/2-oxohepta-3-ene-1,7-dioic acid hydratase in catechol pathway
VVRHHWADARAAHAAGAFDGGRPVADVHLGPPMPEPRAIYAVGLNYKGHAEESGMEPPPIPGIFTKFPTSLAGPFDDIVLPAGMNDWEAELTFVVADGGRHVAAADAYDAVLGFTIAQDISERGIQFQAMSQFSMGKSFDTFCPCGPAIVTLDELADPADLGIVCRVNGEVMQDDRTSGLIFDVPALVEFISSICTLRAGDLCLTGTPAGVGFTRGLSLQPGDVVETEIEGLGTMRNRCVAA